MNKILPSILDVKDLQSFLNIISNTDISCLHIDIMDGIFTEKKCGDLESILKVKENGFLADVHLMVNEPVDMAKKAKNYGVDSVTIHYEIPDFENALNELLKENIKVGVSICPNTDINVLEPFLKHINHVLIMSVVPGKGGQTFIESTFNKIEKLRELSDIEIIVDGGINDTNIVNVFKTGADKVIVGSYITKNIDDCLVKIERLESLINLK